MATPDPQPTEQGQGWNLQPYGSQLDLLTTEPQRELLTGAFNDSLSWFYLSQLRAHAFPTDLPPPLLTVYWMKKKPTLLLISLQQPVYTERGEM